MLRDQFLSSHARYWPVRVGASTIPHIVRIRPRHTSNYPPCYLRRIISGIPHRLALVRNMVPEETCCVLSLEAIRRIRLSGRLRKFVWGIRRPGAQRNLARFPEVMVTTS
jgi:hypothetical protein